MTGKNTDEDAVWNKMFTRGKKISGAPCINVGVIGNASVGKTSLCRKYARKNDTASAKVVTLGIDVEYIFLEAFGESIKVKIWDTAG